MRVVLLVLLSELRVVPISALLASMPQPIDDHLNNRLRPLTLEHGLRLGGRAAEQQCALHAGDRLAEWNSGISGSEKERRWAAFEPDGACVIELLLCKLNFLLRFSVSRLLANIWSFPSFLTQSLLDLVVLRAVRRSSFNIREP